MKNQREDGGIGVLEMFGERGLEIEVAVGRNGRVWVKAEGGGGVRETIAVGRALREVDGVGLGVHAQEKVVKRVLGELGR